VAGQMQCNTRGKGRLAERMQDAGFSLPNRLLFQENYLSRMLCGRTNQSSSPDAKSQKEKDAATNTCLGT
jgi:hypothetical protein